MPPPQPSAAAATTAAAGPPLRARLFPQVCGGMVAALAQTLVVLRTHQGRSAAEFALALMPAAVLFVPLVLVPVLVPRLWVKHGAAVAVATRLAFFEVLKIPGSGGANKLLQGQPSAGGGLLGFIKDMFVLTVGSRCLVIAGLAFLTAASTPVPLLVELVLQLFVMWHFFDAGLVCASPLLRHPTWQRRISSIHSVANLLQLLTISAVLPASMGSAGMAKVFRRTSDAERCHVCVNFFGLLYPLVGAMLISARIHRAAPWHGEWRRRWRARLPCSSCGAGGGSIGSQRLGSCPRCVSCAVALVRRAFAAADEWLEGVCSFSWCQGSWIAWLASWWPLLSTLWTLSLHLSAKAS